MSKLKQRLQSADPLGGALPDRRPVPAADVSSTFEVETSPRSRPRLAWVAASAGALALACGAVALIAGLGSSDRTANPPAVTPAKAPPAASFGVEDPRRYFAVLRRPARPDDRVPADLRAGLNNGPLGRKTILYDRARAIGLPGVDRPARLILTADDRVCLLVPVPGTAQAFAGPKCASGRNAAARRIVGTLRADGAWYVYRLVPDEVRRVRVDAPGRPSRTVQVADNLVFERTTEQGVIRELS